MSDYKRIVSYMYDYQDGVKKNNVGFARVEARNDQCKIMINIKAPSLNNNTLKGYMFYRNDDVLIPIFIGNLVISNGIGDIKAVTRANDIMNTSKKLDEMCGIIVYFNDDKYYATEWDDKPIVLHNFVHSEGISKEEVLVIDDEQQEKKCDEINTDEMEPQKQDMKEVIKEFIEDMIEDDKKEKKEEDVDNKVDDIQEVFKDTKDDIEDVIEDIKEGIQSICEDNKKECVKKDIVHNEYKTISEKENTTSPIAVRIFSRYTKMFPFEDNEIVECVKIEPQDIGAFPIENWVLGNNSFLLHGYYNYRHLIFARKKTMDGNQYIIGVPGLFQSREKFMAKLFGFEDFKPTKQKEPEQGEFGYWYTTINL